MAGYRRFVIYLYWCHKEKVQNVGFAKIELQNNQCRIEVHLKGLPQEDLTLPVYLFSRDENSAEGPVLWGVELGKIDIKRGIGKFGRIFSIEKIGGSPFRYQDMNGMLIPLDMEEMVAGQWDNKDIIQQQFRVWSPDAESAATESSEPTIAPETAENSEPAATPGLTENTEPAIVPKAAGNTEPAATPGSTENTEPAIVPKAAGNIKPAVTPGSSENTEPASAPETTEYTASLSDTVSKEDAAPKENSPLSSESSQAKGKAPTETNDMLHMQQLAYDFGEKRPQKAQKQNLSQEIASDWEQMWKMLSSRREAFAPMEGKDILAVKIDLKDLHLLPEDLWNLGNNSFLLHGFFNYRFLLYGRIRQENGSPYYFIGIPGVFSNQEKVLAAIFGFPEFYLERKAEIQTGKSGYWCKLLMSSDNNAYK